MVKGSRAFAAMFAASLAMAACGGTSTSGPAASSCIKAPGTLLNAGQLTFGSDISYPPAESMQNNQPVGVDVDLGAALAGKVCLKSVFQNQNFDGIFPALTAKKFDAILSALTITPKRQEVADFVSYLKVGRVIIALKSRNLHLNDLTGLCGRKVAVEAGTDELDAIKAVQCPQGQSIGYAVYPTDTEAQEQLHKATVDARVTSSLQGGYAVKLDPSLAVVSPVLQVEPYAIAVRKGDSGLLAALQQALAAIEQDGSYAKILSKWGLSSGDVRNSS